MAESTVKEIKKRSDRQDTLLEGNGHVESWQETKELQNLAITKTLPMALGMQHIGFILRHAASQ